MKRFEKVMAVASGGLLLAQIVRADVAEPAGNPYQVIVDRNPFALVPIPPPPTNTAPVAPQVPVNVKITGITRDGALLKAWLAIPPQPGKNTNYIYYSLAEHEQQDDIQVQEINEREESVKILNAGVPAVLTFKDNSFAAPAGLPVPGAPHGVPNFARPGVIPPPAVKTAAAAPAAMSPELATRYGLSQASAAQTIPTRHVRTLPVASSAQATEAEPVDPAVQRILMEAQAERARQNGVPFPPLPPLPGATGK